MRFLAENHNHCPSQRFIQRFISFFSRETIVTMLFLQTNFKLSDLGKIGFVLGFLDGLLQSVVTFRQNIVRLLTDRLEYIQTSRHQRLTLSHGTYTALLFSGLYSFCYNGITCHSFSSLKNKMPPTMQIHNFWDLRDKVMQQCTITLMDK